jgi:hypothetical protein
MKNLPGTNVLAYFVPLYVTNNEGFNNIDTWTGFMLGDDNISRKSQKNFLTCLFIEIKFVGWGSSLLPLFLHLGQKLEVLGDHVVAVAVVVGVAEVGDPEEGQPARIDLLSMLGKLFSSSPTKGKNKLERLSLVSLQRLV